MNRWWQALGAAVVVGLGAGAWAQNGAPPAEVPSAMPSVFATFPRPKADLPFLEYQSAWPDRWVMSGDGRRGVIVPIKNPEAFPNGYRLGGHGYSPVNEADLGTVLGGRPAPEGTPIVYGGPGGFVYRFTEPEDGKPIPRGKRNTAQEMFKFVSLQSDTIEGKPALVVEETWFAVYEPAKGQQARGVALISPGLLGTPVPFHQAVATRLSDEGWLVLRMLSQSSRFSEVVAFELDASGDLQAQAKTIAKVTGDRAAECAYATQAAMAHLEEQRPELKTSPRVALGFSGGAMTLPTIIAREPERYAAAIMVAGGADFWLMNQRSNYRGLIDAVRENWKTEKPAPEVLTRLDEQYLKNAPLDSYHTAAALKGKPVLLIQGTADKAVPAPLGDLLWERLGRPERWLDEGGTHESLFMNFQRDYFPRMMEWLDRACPRPAQAAPEDPRKDP